MGVTYNEIQGKRCSEISGKDTMK